MAFDMDSDRCVGFKRRITEIGDTQETPPSPPPPQFSTSLCTVHQDDKEEQDIAENKNLSLLSDSKKSKSSSHYEASEIIIEGNQELGFASGAQQSREVLGSLASGPSENGDFVNKVEDFDGEVQKTENYEAGYVCDGEAKQEKFDIEKGGVEETAKESFLSASADKEEKAFVKSEVGVVVGSATEENKELGKEFESESLLEVKKKQLLEKLEVVLMAEDKSQAEKITDFEGSLKIEVIDQTALIDFNDKCAESKGNNNLNQEVDGKKARRSRRKAKKVFEMNRKNALVRGEPEIGCRKTGDGTKKLYSRNEMEALRFTNIVEQRKIWKVIYNELGAAVAREYEDLTSSKHQKHIRVNFDHRQRFAKQEEAPAIFREACSENMDSDIKDMESNETESLSPLDPTCSQSVSGEYGHTGLEEDSSDDDDSEEDYASIQKPAFLVEGEPNFDSGPPEDGFEYLRRVRAFVLNCFDDVEPKWTSHIIRRAEFVHHIARYVPNLASYEQTCTKSRPGNSARPLWEASQIPKVKVAKFDRSKFNKEQSVYMPQIPDIARCPEHLLPLKEWEDAFLTDFSELRVALSRLQDSSEELSGKLQPMFVIHEKCHSRDLPWILENLDTEEVYPKQPHDFSGPESSIVQPTMLTPEDNDTSLPSEHSSPKTSADESSGPLLSAILRMDSVARVSTLKKRISSVETTNALSRNDCVWLFALCAAVDTPLDADTIAALRSLLRKCAILRAAKSELDDEVVMLNILTTVAGRYYGQSGS